MAAKKAKASSRKRPALPKEIDAAVKEGIAVLQNRLRCTLSRGALLAWVWIATALTAWPAVAGPPGDASRDGGNDDAVLARPPPVLDAGALLALHPGVVGAGRQPRRAQELGHPLRGLLQRDVDDRRAAGALAQPLQQGVVARAR